ncbi:MAG: N-6 DNA methylase, partial [Deltaproteobacteria bacterium]|nr:N-6 DNA methylase [Deltaproteobacteria bacterium]
MTRLMKPLDKTLRHRLDLIIMQAREVAENAARIALENLGVGNVDPPPYLNKKERELRHRLQIHGRQISDNCETTLTPREIDFLIEEVAYEHWHRMLFAKFLSENNLLMYPDPLTPISITLEECESLAHTHGATNGWELAAIFATKMLPQVFPTDTPVFDLTFPPENSQKLEKLLRDLPREIFTASDSLGWVYQLWQTAKKSKIHFNEIKIGPLELPSVTQLFTDPYMVNFLLDNSLGAWWAEKRLKNGHLHSKSFREDGVSPLNEEKLRRKAAIPGVPLEYLRIVIQEGGDFSLASGTNANLPDNFSELKILDPCCGSGHFLVAAFLMLVPMRMESEGLSARDAVDAVLRENIYGLELERRCLELAAFALSLNAWKYKDAGGYRQLPELNLACSGLSFPLLNDISLHKLEIGDKNLITILDRMKRTFKDAPILGSLISPSQSDVAILENKLIFHLNDSSHSQDKPSSEQKMFTAKAHELVKTAKLLCGKYHFVVTNVPYLTKNKQNECLRDFCRTFYPASHRELAMVFLERCLEFCAPGGTTSLVIPQNLLFLSTFKKLREKLLNENQWRLLARLGMKAFEYTDSWNINIMLLSLSSGYMDKHNFSLLNDNTFLDNIICCLDVSNALTPAIKSEMLKTTDILTICQEKQLKNSDVTIGLEEKNFTTLLRTFAKSLAGMQSGDAPHFCRHFWELPDIFGEWVFLQSPAGRTIHYGGKSLVLWFGADFREATKNTQTRIQGMDAWDKEGIVIEQMRKMRSSIHTGARHNNNCAVLLAHNPENLPAIWCFCSSPQYNEAVRKVDQKVNVTNATLVKVPFELDYWTKVAKQEYPHGLPEPYTNNPTQWIFHGHPCASVIWDEQKKQTTFGPLRTDPTVLQVAVARLLGYRWPAEIDKSLKLAKEQREIVKRCETLKTFADNDGIVPLPPLLGKASASDRLLNLLIASYGESWSNATLNNLIKNVNCANNLLDYWLRTKFFSQHCKLFRQRPFIWHIWDGQKNGFAVLINYHKLDFKLLETLTYTYLGDWIDQQKKDVIKKVDGAARLLNASLNLQTKLELILNGEAPYDIFVRWKALEKQASGWNPDLFDGVRLNIRPFLTVPDVSHKNAGILRNKPKIYWTKDLGRDHESAPWYQTFKGDRINDHHLTLQ